MADTQAQIIRDSIQIVTDKIPQRTEVEEFLCVEIPCPKGYEPYNTGSLDKDTDTVRTIYRKKAPVLPARWEDIRESKEGWYIDGNSVISRTHAVRHILGGTDRNSLPTKELAQAMLAMCQLLYLRDIYRQGWVPDWTDDSYKYEIIYNEGQLYKDELMYHASPMSFQSEEIRDLFMKNFADLLEQAKELL
jgi:hypothetical protein